MSQENNRMALELARKQKRLKSWRESFNSSLIAGQIRGELENLLNTYSLLIAKLASCADTSDMCECEERISGVERSLSAAFDSHRLAKSALSPIKK